MAYTGVIPLVAEAVKELHARVGPLLPLAQVADKLGLAKDGSTLEVKGPMKVGGDLLVAGGLAYSLGSLFFLLDQRLRYGHLVWHLFVITGSACHVLAVQRML